MLKEEESFVETFCLKGVRKVQSAVEVIGSPIIGQDLNAKVIVSELFWTYRL